MMSGSGPVCPNICHSSSDKNRRLAHGRTADDLEMTLDFVDEAAFQVWFKGKGLLQLWLQESRETGQEREERNRN